MTRPEMQGHFLNAPTGPLVRADRETLMTHITEARVIGNHADMGSPVPTAARSVLTVTDIQRAGMLRTAMRMELAAAQSIWDADGGATKPGTSASDEADG